MWEILWILKSLTWKKSLSTNNKFKDSCVQGNGVIYKLFARKKSTVFLLLFFCCKQLFCLKPLILYNKLAFSSWIKMRMNEQHAALLPSGIPNKMFYLIPFYWFCLLRHLSQVESCVVIFRVMGVFATDRQK